MKKPTTKLIALILTLLMASSLGVAALANDSTIEIGTRPNTAPIAENLEFETFKGVALTGRFKALDPDGDALTFEITAVPKKGSVTPTDNGGFVYTPADKSKGKDAFSYVAVDANGGVSSTATVTIDIKKQSTKTSYSDMDGNPAHYASLVMSERGIFTGEQLGDESFFRPTQSVSRGEFLAMCMKATGSEPIVGITRTGFTDDESIPVWAKPYVSAALMGGVVSGTRTEDGQVMFNSDAPITFAEAAVIINNSLGITDVLGVALVDGEVVPAWAQSASANLTACNILPTGLSGIADETVTRADAAEMILASLNVLDSRDSGTSLLSWAR